MQLLEFQAKELFREYGINLLDSKSSTNIEEGRKHAKELGYPFVIKIQVPVGGRGKAGGIQMCHNDDEFELKYPQVMDLTIKGEKARAILLEKMADIKKELYLSIFLNRSKRCYTIIASAEGGVEIESIKTQIIKEIGMGDVSDEIASDVAKEMGLDFVVPDGAMYLFARVDKDGFDGVQFANSALEKGLAVAPGEGFGDYKNFIRISACQDEKILIDGMNILSDIMSEKQ
jgi:succinyl-CoA synthetase beta subunit